MPKPIRRDDLSIAKNGLGGTNGAETEAEGRGKDKTVKQKIIGRLRDREEAGNA
jgi:hypothetical protein